MAFVPQHSLRAQEELKQSGGASIWAQVTAMAVERKAINLGQGYPDFPGHSVARERAAKAILDEPALNQYTPIGGLPALGGSISAYYGRAYPAEQHYDPASEVMVTASGTEALYVTMQALISPGDEVILFEPYFPWYLPAIRLAGGTPVVITLEPPRFAYDEPCLARFAAAVTPRTRAVIMNTPHNPTGHVATAAELEAFAAVVRASGPTGMVCIADEVYENILFGDAVHTRIAALPEMRERTLCVGSASKLFSLTGWRVGWILGGAELLKSIKMVHGYAIFCAPAPLQIGVAAAFDAEAQPPPAAAADGDAAMAIAGGCNFEGVPALLERNFAALAAALSGFGLSVCDADGGYFLVADIAGAVPASMGDSEFCKWLIDKAGVACMPMNVFYSREGPWRCTLVRFCVCKTAPLIDAACEALGRKTAAQHFAESG
jgi:aspartate/methionine/tyrosine aminotransferase